MRTPTLKAVFRSTPASTSLVASLALLLPLALPGAGCKKPETPQVTAPKEAKQTRVEVEGAVKHTFSGRIPITGELKPIQEVTLKSRVGGNVVVLNFDEGDQVKKGQLIAKIEANSQNATLRSNQAAVSVNEAQYARAQADLERAKRDYERVKKLFDQGAAEQKILDDSESALKLATVAVRMAGAQIDQAKASRDLAKNSLGETQYKAPISGVISRRGVSLHEYVDTMKNRDIVTIVDNSAMELVASVAADLAGGLTKGAKVEFQVNGPASNALTGEVIAVNPTVDSRTRTIRLRVRIPNTSGVLKGGMYATGYVTVGGERQGVGVPAQALKQESVSQDSDEGAEVGGGEEEKQSVVWVVRGGLAQKLVVRTGVQDGNLVEVIGPVMAGDQIIVSSPAGLKPGIKVVVQAKEAPAQAAAAAGSPGSPG